MLTCSVVGATSFTGNELIRILVRHPHVKIGFLTTRSDEHVYARDLVPTLGKANDLVIEKTLQGTFSIGSTAPAHHFQRMQPRTPILL